MPVGGVPHTLRRGGGYGPAIECLGERFGGDLWNLANSNLLPLVTFW